MQSEIPSIAGPSTSLALSTQGDGKPQNVNFDMWGVLDWDSFMDVLDSTEKEASAEPAGMLDGPPNTMTPATAGTGRGKTDP